MKLTHNTIPKGFLENIPRGMKYVLRNGKDYLVTEQVFCPNGHSLMVDHVRLHSEPSINMIYRVGESQGLIFVDSFWGSHDKLYGFIPDVNAADALGNDVFCPSCNCSLIVESETVCGSCGSEKVLEMQLPGGINKILACSKIGCPWHKIEADEIQDEYRAMVDDINFFGI